MPEVNKEHLQVAAVIAAGLIQSGPQDSKKSEEGLVKALVTSYRAVQEAVRQIEQGQPAK
mgnify:CR=1 FL=1|jgi:hypothetical protein